jgi:GT2 family glycosyltransferase
MPKDQLPRISVVIPTHARPRRLRDCIISLSKLSYPRDRFEVIVVDDDSPEPVARALHDLCDLVNLHCLRQPRGGPARARNLGLEHALGDLVAFTDDDCRPREGWLANLADGHRRNPQMALAGPVVNAIHSSIAAETSQVLVDYLSEYFDPPGTGRGFFPSNNLTFPAKQLRALGGFSSDFPLAGGEDRELCARWSDHGYPFGFLPDAVVDHFHDMNVVRFSRQQFNYGRGVWYYSRARAEQVGESLKSQPLRFYAGMFASAFRRRPFSRSLRICPLVALSQALIAAGYFTERCCSGSRRQSASPTVRKRNTTLQRGGSA